MKKVKQVLYAQPYNMGGFPVRQPFPTSTINQIDPFLLLHHANVKVPTTIPPHQAGIGPHPHRGFAPVTFVLAGGVKHRDSRGNQGEVYANGVQWMEAGMGIIHSERPTENIHEIGGRQEIIQLWINTPSNKKMESPTYQNLPEENLVSILLNDGYSRALLVSGSLLNVHGPAKTHSKVTSALLLLNSKLIQQFELPEKEQLVLYIAKGSIKVNGYGIVEQHHAIIFEIGGEQLSIETITDATVLLLSGTPLEEKIATYGPFVMNTESQILEAMRDYQLGKMGVLIED